ncbi:hypothetical protein AYI70_g3241 [Smittium culicis]|nr:hypothetical protein AYI70_g3241 [Smittium culicis]
MENEKLNREITRLQRGLIAKSEELKKEKQKFSELESQIEKLKSDISQTQQKNLNLEKHLLLTEEENRNRESQSIDQNRAEKESYSILQSDYENLKIENSDLLEKVKRFELENKRLNEISTALSKNNEKPSINDNSDKNRKFDSKINENSNDSLESNVTLELL